jgi:exodeoxyribonuclease V alpha subunit
MSRALIDLLTRRHGLTAEAEPVVQALLDAWQQGHTALALTPEQAALMAASPAVATDPAGPPRPLILLPGPLLQSWRLHQAERRIHTRLQALATAAAYAVPKAVMGALNALFPEAGGQQRAAAELGLRRPLALISGGPGTGKTYTAARLLALAALQTPGLRLGLAAPTGKAAQRLGESLAAAADHLPPALAAGAQALREAGRRSQTLHRLLAWNPGTDACGYHAQRPLPLDLVLVDEASMLDVALWDSLLQALAPGARLVILGDPHQLESVEPGRVLGGLVEAAQAQGPLAGCHVELRQNHRFAQHPAIGQLADAIRAHDAQALLTTLQAGHADAALYPSRQLDQALAAVWPEVLALAQATDPAAALTALARLRLLCAVNQGPWGVDGLNRRISARLQQQGHAAHAKPLLVTVNDPSSGLFNGDLGVELPDGRVAFGDPAQPRVHPLGQVPEHKDAWAITVHRAQGSEYATVLLVLPPEGADNVGPELLYTAVTRAKERVLLVAEQGVLAEGVKLRQRRVTSLGLPV